MTLSTTTNKVSYAGNGSTTVFAVPFLFLANSHITVIHADSNGTETTWVENTQYTLTGALNPAGGTLTVKTTPTDYTHQTNETLTIVRIAPYTQETDYVQNDSFGAETHETALDKNVMLIQQLKEQLDRSLLFPISTSTTNFELPAPEAGLAIGWNAGEDGLVNLAVPDVTIALAANTYVKRNAGNTAFDTLLGSAVWDDIKVSADETTVGIAEIATQAETNTGTDDTRIVTPLKLATTLSTTIGAMPRGHVDGLVTELDTDTDHDVKINIGECRDSTDTQDIKLASAIVKQIDVAWAASTDATPTGGFPTGISLAVDTWYYVFLIYDVTNGLTDAGFDTSLTAANLLADATDYTKYQLIGFALTDGSSNILGYLQIGDTWYWDAPVSDIATSSAATASTAATLSTPLGVKTEALVAFSVFADTAAVYTTRGIITHGDLSAPGPTANKFMISANRDSVTGAYNSDSAFIQVYTNTSSQINYRFSDSRGDVDIMTFGFKHRRGKDA